MRTHAVVAFAAPILVLLAAACSAIHDNAGAPHPKFDPEFDAAYGPRVARSPGRSGVHLAVWTLDEDANLAYPTCPACDSVCATTDTACEHCGTKIAVKPVTIRCPECGGSKACAHCAPGHCDACESSHVCAVCDGTGTWSGVTCPECNGTKACDVCASGSSSIPCDHCDATHVCSDCGGSGSLELK